MAAMAKLGHREGVLDADESRVLESLLRFRSLSVRDVMTPRTVVMSLPEETTVGEVVVDPARQRFSRIPIYHETPNAVTGYVLKDQVLLQAAEGSPDTPLRELRRELHVVPETLSLPRLFERLLARGEHIALAIDEFGGVAGVVTIEDVIETLLGLEIVDEADSVEDMQQLARDRWRQRAARLGLLEDEGLAHLFDGSHAEDGKSKEDRR
jgi:CBS domain containing-hemolysin-like protein